MPPVRISVLDNVSLTGLSFSVRIPYIHRPTTFAPSDGRVSALREAGIPHLGDLRRRGSEGGLSPRGEASGSHAPDDRRGRGSVPGAGRGFSGGYTSAREDDRPVKPEGCDAAHRTGGLKGDEAACGHAQGVAAAAGGGRRGGPRGGLVVGGRGGRLSFGGLLR